MMCLVEEIVVEFSRASMLGVLRRRASVLALLSFSVVSLLWFLYWIGYDIVVWSKPLLKVNVVNYAGAVLSLAVISAGFRLRPKKMVGTLDSGQDELNLNTLKNRAADLKRQVEELKLQLETMG
jgi:hypothetical protein